MCIITHQPCVGTSLLPVFRKAKFWVNTREISMINWFSSNPQIVSPWGRSGSLERKEEETRRKEEEKVGSACSVVIS